MCQLLGVSAASPIRIRLSWQRFALRGSELAGNPDGWGIVYGEHKNIQVLREDSPAADSDLVKFLGAQGLLGSTIISHVRRATMGDRTLVNTQPFSRAVGGRIHAFAHNGHIPGLESLTNPYLQPVGTTDSERMFNKLLDLLVKASQEERVDAEGLLPLERRTAIISEFAEDMRSRGAANFLYFDGSTLFAHGHRKTLPGAALSTEAGLYLLESPQGAQSGALPCEGIDASEACVGQSIIATVPLDEQEWRPLAEGELVRIENGVVV